MYIYIEDVEEIVSVLRRVKDKKEATENSTSLTLIVSIEEEPE